MGNLRYLIWLGLILLAGKAPATTMITNIASGCWANDSLFIQSDSSLWGMGLNGYGQLALPEVGSQLRPRQILASNVIAVACGTGHSLFVQSDHTVWGVGDNYQGQLGLTNVMRTNAPVKIPLNNIVAVAAGSGHSLFLKSDGSLWGVGNDTQGQLGDGGHYFAVPYGPREVEQIVPGGVTAIAAGEQHSLFIKDDGSLWAMGADSYGQLGDGNPNSPQFYPDPGVFTNLPEEIVASNVVAVAAGCGHTLFLKADSSLWGMGWNFYGQLGDGTFISTNRPELLVASNVTAIAAGGYHSLFLKSDGSLWAMGRNVEGQLGDGTFGNAQNVSSNVNEPEQIVASNVVAIAAGEFHSLFLKSDGSLWATGYNHDGQLGDGFDDYGSLYHGVASPERILPPPPPTLALTLSSGTNWQFDADCGFGGSFVLLASTNPASPPDEWMPAWTNVISYRYDAHFLATLTNAVNLDGSRFFRLQSQ